jgi:hypothetical protein
MRQSLHATTAPNEQNQAGNAKLEKGKKSNVRWVTSEPMSNIPDSASRNSWGVVVALTSDMWIPSLVQRDQ